MQVRKIMSSPVIGIGLWATIRDAAIRMRTGGVGALPVFEKDKAIGIVTDRDIVTRALGGPGCPLAPDAAVRSIMSPDVITCFQDEDVTRAAAVMGDRQIRRLLVLDRSGGVVGILSVGDIAEHASEELAGQVLGEISEARARNRPV